MNTCTDLGLFCRTSDNTEKGECMVFHKMKVTFFCKLKFSYFCSWIKTHILFSPLLIGRHARKIMRTWSSGPKTKLRVQRFVYWTNYFIHQKELCETQTVTVSLSPNILLLVTWIRNEESLHWFTELIIKTGVSKTEGSTASVRVKKGCCAFCRLSDL